MERFKIKELTNRLRFPIQRQLRLLDLPGESQSRKLQGQYNDYQERRSIGSLFVYLERGLASHLDLAAPLVSTVESLIQQECEGSYPRLVFSFGNPDHLGWSDKSRISNLVRMNDTIWRDVITSVAGTDTGAASSVIPGLMPNTSYANRMPSRQEDLLLFFCWQGQPAMTPECHAAYRCLKSHAFWFFLDPSSPGEVDVALGNFAPRTSN
jgi:hypothetical protein